MVDILEVLKIAVKSGASDVHLVIGSPPLLRIHGEMKAAGKFPPLTAEESKKMIYSILLENQKAELEREWEMDCSFGIDSIARFRINVFNQKNGIEAVMRIIPSKIPTPDEIGLTSAITNLATAPRGLVLVTGPTGSGKSTTLASLLQIKNEKDTANIITIEDPIEFTYVNKKSIFRQREVGHQTKSFTKALRSALRQDPDVILVGEMRDLETIGLALTAAETGHLCFATLHTQDAPTTIDRIIDVFPPHQQTQIRIQLATTLKAVISQTLLPRKNSPGLIAAREVMFVTPAVANMIRESKTHMLYNAIETGAKEGMVSMDKSLAKLVRQGLVDIELAQLKARSKESFKEMLNKYESSSSDDFLN
ncbi:MAG TPA: type IV pilus twitching motility protein PilT [Elusimicrobiales bacterium]|nr:type IV pilus twitching motility protein PilT [Elusimicrobiales bacterium]